MRQKSSSQQKRKKLVAVIGYANSGKSTIIQSLSGCRNHSYKGFIKDGSLNVSIYVHAASPQEYSGTAAEDLSKILNAVKRNRTCQGLLIAVQPTVARKRRRMTQMFDLAKPAGFESYAFILEFPYDEQAERNIRIGNFENIKAQVLEDGDSRAKVFSIDARRFVSLNSEAIRSIARFPY